jgi:protein-S-isoprenylcysteine O-methyltransferase Ste14
MTVYIVVWSLWLLSQIAMNRLLKQRKLFTVTVTIRENHAVKADGIYSVIRHPAYLGSIMSFMGFGISLNNWVSFIVVPLPVLLAMHRRISVEERLLTDHFGDEYREYMKKTKRLVPWVY